MANKIKNMSEAHLLVKSHNIELKQNLAAAIADRFRTDSPVDGHFKNIAILSSII